MITAPPATSPTPRRSQDQRQNPDLHHQRVDEDHRIYRVERPGLPLGQFLDHCVLTDAADERRWWRVRSPRICRRLEPSWATTTRTRDRPPNLGHGPGQLALSSRRRWSTPSDVDGQPVEPQHQMTPPGPAGRPARLSQCEDAPAVFVALDAEQADRQLRAGRLGCPGCGARLRPWAWARPRPVRLLRGGVAWLR